MKLHGIVIVLLAAGMSLIGFSAAAQEETTDLLSHSFTLADQTATAKIGARALFDGAWYYNAGLTQLKPGVRFADARLRASLKSGGWYFYADFDFSKGRVTQKNLFMEYTLALPSVNHAFKVGYYSNPATMSGNTSFGSLHFFSRPAPVMALGPKRELGFSYSAYNDHFFTNQGVFATNFHDADMIGFQNLAAGGRWLYRYQLVSGSWLHIGATFRYENLLSGERAYGQLMPTLKLSGSLETRVDQASRLVGAELPWAKHVYDVTAEFLYMRPNLFLRGEYLFKHVTKARDGKKMLESQLGGAYSWTTVESMEKGLPLRANSFHGGYVEAGYKFFGPDYTYSTSEAVMGGLKGFALEGVMRYSYLGLNDIVPGEWFMPGRNQYYPASGVADYPAASTSVGGGNLHSMTLGLNFSFNRYAMLMAGYTCSLLQRDLFPQDKMIHTIQLRLQMQI